MRMRVSPDHDARMSTNDRLGDGMIREDASACCLLPMNTIQKNWPSDGGYLGGHIPYAFEGVNEKLKEDRGAFSRVYHPGKY